MKNIKILYFFLISLVLTECHNKQQGGNEPEVKVITPVRVVTPEYRTINDIVNFRSTSSYLKKNSVKANMTGYIEKNFINIGDQVTRGKVLFVVQTKEAKALQNLPDSIIKFKGESPINAPSSGIVTEVNKQNNDYVSEGDQLCVIAESSSIVFLMNVPYEMNRIITPGKNCRITLPDSTSLYGTVISRLSTVDPASQTQVYVVKPQNISSFSENLSAVVQIVKSIKEKAQVIKKSCVLADETMENFWVMKLINDSTAVKVPVKKGLTSDSLVEIVDRKFKISDRIISSGNYGLGDSALVKIIQP